MLMNQIIAKSPSAGADATTRLMMRQTDTLTLPPGFWNSAFPVVEMEGTTVIRRSQSTTVT